ncbi:MAG: hypothetical protein QOH71_1770 [Blastocatellia bacterium]|jgi:uncharacterized repeat protein (TIGR01451 family)|nr:hypothetical protein [Blastocatellia bacterium]
MKKFISITFVLLSVVCLFAASAETKITPVGAPTETDLGITKTGPDSIAPGANITYTITVTNAGPDAGVNARVNDTLSAGLTFVSIAAPAGWSCPTTPTVGTNGPISCSNANFGLTNGEVFTLVARVDAGTPTGTFVSNRATILSDTPDINSENDSSTSSAVVTGASADLGVNKIASADTISADSDLTYTITVSNGGPDTATSATLTDTIPGNLSFVSLSQPAGWTCSPLTPGSGGTLSCSRDLPAGSGAQVFTLVTHIPAETADGTFYNNMASVSTTTSDPNPDNNSSAAPTIVGCFTDPVVTTNADSGSGSLRQAIKDACTGSTITFSNVVSPIILTTGELFIDKNLTIKGPSTGGLSISGNNNSRVFNINSGRTVGLSKLTITNGKADIGGGLYNLGNLTIANSTFIGNNAASGAGEGGAIDAEGGTLTIVNTTISGNKAETDGGGLLNCGSSTATLINVTLTNNFADSDNNGSGAGGGIGQVSGNALTLHNTIVAGNFNEDGATDTADDLFVNTAPPSALNGASSNNLIGVNTGFTGITNGAQGNQIGTAGAPIDPLLGALANNGGPTQTHLLKLGSPAINTGKNANLPPDTLDLNEDTNTSEVLPVDQRGFPRIVNSIVDIGAVEVNYAFTAAAGTPQSATVNTAFATALKATVTESGIAQSGISVTFTAPGSGASGTFPGPSATAVVSTDGSGSATAPTFTANAIGGSYNVVASSGGGLPTVTFALTNNKLSQTINFPAPTDKTFGDPDFTVSATATSGLAVSFAASGNCTVSGTGTGTVHITGAGPCTITASQAGDASYNAAPSVPRTFNIAKAATTTAVTSSVNPSTAGQSVTFTATVTSTAGAPTGTVQFKDNGVNLGSSQAVNGSGVAQVTTSSLTGGLHSITADYSGDGNFNVSTGTLSGGQIVGAAVTFSATTYNTTENSRAVTITVQRTGDTSLAVTVDYATPDDSSATPTILPCSTPGFVSPRCDFTTAAGTLKFAAGENSKTFDVLISQDNYVEGSESFPVTLSNPTNGAVLGSPSTANVVIADDVTEPAANPIDDSTNFVRQHYHDFLNREPIPGDSAGLNFWVNQIESCGSDQACRDLKRVNVSGAFFLSVEFQQTGYYVYRTYKTAFGDINPPTVPVPVRYREFNLDTQEMQRGVIVGQGAWQAQIDANKQAYALAFVKRSDFLARYPALTSATAFVDTLNGNAGNVLTPNERSALISELSSNSADPALRADVLMKIAENALLKQNEFNRAFVLMQYFGYLRRNPDAAPEPGLNFGGFNFWLTKLNQFNGNFVNADMVKAFITSSEYRKRFGQ